ncbi:MAG TPA: hypothetical protein VHI52_04930 [Verrucomicrobiae bacterium]|nr:hypothetical protein [Verrucomicrobiae bacterium]
MKSTTILDFKKPMQTRAVGEKSAPLLFRTRALFTQSLVVRPSAVGLAIALPAFAGASAASEPVQEAARAHKSSLGQYALPDSFLHVTAWTFVAPQEWTRTGGVYWTGRLLPLAYYSELKITNSKGSEQLELFPTAIYVATRDPMWAAGPLTCPYLQADECIRRILLPQYRPRARDVKVIAIDKQPRQLLAEGEARVRAQGAAQCDVRAARVLVEYQEGERTMREMFFCTLMALPAGGGPTVWCVERALGLRADKENFEQSYRMLGLITSSLRENQSWVAARGRQLRAMVPPPTPRNSAGGPSILDVSRSISRNNDEFLKNIDAVNTARLNTPASDGWTRAYRNTERVVNPSTGEEMDVAGGYLQYYQDYSDRIYASNDPTDFYLQTRIGGTVLQPAQ